MPYTKNSNFSLKIIKDKGGILNSAYFKLNYENLELYSDLELLIKELDKINKETRRIHEKEMDRYYILLPNQSKNSKLKIPQMGSFIYFDNEKYNKYLIDSKLLLIKDGFVKHDLVGYYSIF